MGTIAKQGIGLGVASPQFQLHESLGQNNNKLPAEICAIEIKILGRNNMEILSYSQATIMTLTNCKIKSKLVSEITTKLGNSANGTQPWVLEHTSIPC